MINFVICDDSQHILDRLCHLFESAFIKGNFDARISFKTTECEELINYVSNNHTDVVILDIQFNNSKLNGLDVAEKIRKFNKKCYIIFTTSHMEYIFQSFEYKTFSYLIKNTITTDLLVGTLTKLFDDMKGLSHDYLRIDSKDTIIDANDIQFIEKDGMKIIYHTSLQDYEVYSSFSKIEHKLSKSFVRCHKSYVVNIRNISCVKFSTGEIIFRNGSSCYIGPKYKQQFMEAFENDAIIK